ncbi:type IV pilin protein [Dyella sp. RRB7]|uniref:type IV pilin protein n=1 Tax=Dyella sp. RRB7 TaxID=2919502 RepID=UPI0024304722|nr:type IV pilin protein [Dyella sp. RRB7]
MRLRQSPSGKRRLFSGKPGGFTLIEALIVVAIMAILAAIALPTYQSYVRRSRRTAAKTTLLDVARREEAYYSTNNSYTTLDKLGYSGLVGGSIPAPSSNQDYYNVTITLPDPNSQVTGANASFLVTATPQALGGQNQDTCGTYTLTDLGIQGNTGNTDTNCW